MNTHNEHEWLRKLVGHWTFETVCQMGPDKPPMKTTGTEVVRALGEFWIIGEIVGGMPDGSSHTSIITLGFDLVQGRFVGTFVSTIMPDLWIYDGSLDADGKRLTLDAQSPSFAGDGSISKYQDVIDIIDDNHHTLSSNAQKPDGTWVQFMTARYSRASEGK